MSISVLSRRAARSYRTGKRDDENSAAIIATVDLHTLSDAALVDAYKRTAGPERRVLANELFARHYERVGRWCYRLTGDRDSAADPAQDVFLKAHRHLETFQGTSQFSTWLYSIARHESMNRYAKQRTTPVSDPEDSLLEVASLEPTPEESAAGASRRERLHRFLRDTLDETERAVYTLHYGDGMSLEDVTRLLKLENTSGAKAYIVSARRKLARAVRQLRARGEDL